MVSTPRDSKAIREHMEHLLNLIKRDGEDIAKAAELGHVSMIKDKMGSIKYFMDDYKAEEQELKAVEKAEKEAAKAAKKQAVASKSVPVIEEFLQAWKAKAREFYERVEQEYIEQYKAEYEITTENLAAMQRQSFRGFEARYTEEQVAEIMAKLEAGELAGYEVNNLKASIHSDKLRKFRNAHGQGVMAIVDRMTESGYLEKVLNTEVDNKRAKLVAQVEKKAGAIVDASGLYIGDDGGINGYIQGETAKVEVQTIYAGGWNIQCLHYRVLVKPVK